MPGSSGCQRRCSATPDISSSQEVFTQRDPLPGSSSRGKWPAQPLKTFVPINKSKPAQKQSSRKRPASSSSSSSSEESQDERPAAKRPLAQTEKAPNSRSSTKATKSASTLSVSNSKPQQTAVGGKGKEKGKGKGKEPAAKKKQGQPSKEGEDDVWGQLAPVKGKKK